MQNSRRRHNWCQGEAMAGWSTRECEPGAEGDRSSTSPTRHQEVESVSPDQKQVWRQWWESSLGHLITWEILAWWGLRGRLEVKSVGLGQNWGGTRPSGDRAAAQLLCSSRRARQKSIKSKVAPKGRRGMPTLLISFTTALISEEAEPDSAR